MKKINTKMMDDEFLRTLPHTRKEAIAQGIKYYMSTKLCPNQHNSYRRTVNGACAQCQSDTTMKYLVAHPEIDRTANDAKWNHSDKGKTAKQKWKDKDIRWAWAVSAVGGARQRSRAKNLMFDLDNNYIYAMLPETCPVLGNTIIYDNKRGYSPDSPSIDRIDPSKGYVKGNVAVISFRANMIKSDAGVFELEKVLAWLQKQTGKSND